MASRLVLVRMHNQACPLPPHAVSAQSGASRRAPLPGHLSICDRTYTCRYFSWPYLPLPQRTVPWEVAARQSPRSTRRRAAEPPARASLGFIGERAGGRGARAGRGAGRGARGGAREGRGGRGPQKRNLPATVRDRK